MPLLNGVGVVGAFATLWVEMSLTAKIVASVIVLVAFTASTIIQWRIIDASHDESERHDSAQGARDKLFVARHREIIGKIEAQDFRGAVEALQADIALLVPANSPSSNDEPVLSLIFTMPNQFALRNYGGHATNVTIAPVVIEGYAIPGETAVVAEQTVQFPTIDMDYGETKPVTPAFTWLGTRLSGMTMAHFFTAMIKRRRDVGAPPFRIRFPDIEDGMQEEIHEYMRLVWRLENEPLDVEMKLLCDGRATRRRWETIETLHRDPTTRITHVMHGQPREVTEQSVCATQTRT